jgi:hypothetical protein
MTIDASRAEPAATTNGKSIQKTTSIWPPYETIGWRWQEAADFSKIMVLSKGFP